MKKIAAYIFISALMATLFTACGSKQNDITPSAEATTPATSEASATSELSAASEAPAASEPAVASDTPAASNSNDIISKEKAKSIALQDANLKESEISKFHIELDRDDGIRKYDIEFHSGQQEYDYEIDAQSGKIIEKDVEAID